MIVRAWEIVEGDALAVLRGLPDASVACCVTSPPYFGLRDYGVAGQIGHEKTPALYVAALVAVFHEVRRVLAPAGTCWVNLGDSYANDKKWGGSSGGRHGKKALHGSTGIGRGRRFTGLKPKDLIGVPWRVAFALQADGWWLRSEIIWAKSNPMPESVDDRPTRSHEQIFLFSKAERYFYDGEAIRERATCGKHHRNEQGPVASHVPTGQPHTGLRRAAGPEAGRNARDVWTTTTQPNPDAHHATFPEELPRRCILAGTKRDDVVLDPFTGSGTTGVVALSLGRRFIGVELSPEYAALGRRRIEADAPLFNRERTGT